MALTPEKPNPRLGTLDALLDAAVDAIVIADERGRIIRFNTAAERMFGHPESSMRGQNIRNLMPEPWRSLHDSFLQKYGDGGPPSIIGVGREIVGQRSSGEVFPLHLSVGKIAGTGEARYVAIIRDLSEEKATQDRVRELTAHLAHADRLVVLGELTAGIAHEINQPLTAIAAYADAGARLLDKQTPDTGDRLLEICRRVAEQARRAGDVVARLRKLSYKGEVTRGQHDLEALLANVLMLFEHEIKHADVRIETVCEPGLPRLYADEIQVQQVLVNLIKNSFDALRSARVNDPQVRIHICRQGDLISIAVRDNGPGVSSEHQRHLFEPFFTTKPTGVGLGLSICKNIAVAHGGNLTYRPAENGGAEFRLTLPLELIG